jgi:hypothetical protein
MWYFTQMLPVPGSRSAFTRGACALLFAAVMWLGPARPADAVTVARLYEATVPLAERSEHGQDEALQEAMRQVLVRVTGQRNAAYDPPRALVNDARRYVQKFRDRHEPVLAGFDGAKVVG